MSPTPSTNSDIVASVFSESLPSAGTNDGVEPSDLPTARQRRATMDFINRLRNTGTWPHSKLSHNVHDYVKSSIRQSGFPTTMSSTPSTNSVFPDSLSSAGTNGGVGLSDPATASQRRAMLDLISRLRNTGVQRDIDLPMIAVIGNQSAGKSSLIESISGITLPRSQGTCTRCPTECKLTRADTRWTCVIKLHFITDEYGLPIKPKIIPFGDPISDKAHVEERIRRAQSAILNPNTDHEKFLEGVKVPAEENETSFSRNYVSLEISGRELADLSFVDLPGLIASVGRTGSANDIDLRILRIKGRITLRSNMILKGKRTVGVLTKPDRIPLGEEESWIRLIQNEVEPLENNWYCVKQPSSHDISQGITWLGARNMERDFFATTKPWSSRDSHLHQFLGTSRLTERLSAILAELIARRLPEIQEELQEVILQVQSELGELPPEPSSNPVGEIHRVLNGFTKEVSECLKGTPDENGVVQTIRTHFENFKREIYSTAPSFMPWERKDAHRHPRLPVIKFLSNEENVGRGDESDDDEHGPLPATLCSIAIYIDEVMQSAKNGRTRELPDYYPFVVQETYISMIVKKWQEPAIDLFDIVNSIIRERVGKIVDDHFAHLGKGGVKQAVLLHALSPPRMVVYDHLDLAAARAKEKIDCSSRTTEAAEDNNYDLMSNIRKLATDRNRVETVNKALSSLTELGISTQVDDLTRLLPSDPLEVALGIMASVQGYFQVAYKRFIDMVPLAIDYEMVRGLERGLHEALLDGLQVTGADAHGRCAAMLQEPAAIASKRQELTKKLERLRAARY
ncbi:P-loop containing nucleoside triphosphate hydrolase protein [Pisolithus orientalis]|uniref:P-loop containing nucleoside triphosphate hydrolase protein n=1 Tax=Pisolithus orientalis TaxID=936130 RepID=UPI0022242BA4|nr:P-loop containing nucleoside triphosphate hydrolase protein [Pisolithus orientalis]KAI6010935.1 P-loop containing nucleoside triphosphate hydrolase protein [Pisolithus orientalis]